MSEWMSYYTPLICFIAWGAIGMSEKLQGKLWESSTMGEMLNEFSSLFTKEG